MKLFVSAALCWLIVHCAWAVKEAPSLRSHRASALQVEKKNSSQAPSLRSHRASALQVGKKNSSQAPTTSLTRHEPSIQSKKAPSLQSNRASSALQVGKRKTLRREVSTCADGVENRYPFQLLPSYTIVGVGLGRSVWDTETLRDALGNDRQWVIGQPWTLSMKVTNNGRTDRTFGFMGGGSDSGGFLEVTVPAGAIDQVINVSGVVNASAAHTEFQYRSSAAFTSGEVIMSDICLTPKTCKGYVCSSPLGMARADDTTFGHSDLTCCLPRFCADEVACSPDTKYTPKADFEERIGSTLGQCCDAIECPADICQNETKWAANPASGLHGNTTEECCVPRECIDYSCSDPNTWSKLPTSFIEANKTVTRKGSTDSECCESRNCSTFMIPDVKKTVWKMKDNASQLVGNSFEQCCDALFCANFTCPENTQWQPKQNISHFFMGSTEEQCCDKILCSDYTCSKSFLQKKLNFSQRQGSTDEECCEMKFCSSYKCSDPTKWVHLSLQEGNSNLDRRGDSDEECCEKIKCSVEVCNPMTKWQFLNDSVQGSTTEQCCKTVYCETFKCDTDEDGDGQGTQWYRRMDTNTFKWQGATNEECCHPKYCSQYTTLTPTKWKRKPDKELQGSTDTECYTERWCSDYCCVGTGWTLKPNAATRAGSTDMECCTNQTS